MTNTGQLAQAPNPLVAAYCASVNNAPAETTVVQEDQRLSAIAILAAWASYCVSNGVQAGDYHWHGGATPFEADGMQMDAVDYLEYARNQVT